MKKITKTEKTKKHCSHIFEYSHKERKAVASRGMTYREYREYRGFDVVVCIKCGEVRRN